MPSPTSLSSSTKPPLWATIPYTVESPRPEPFPISLVVKNGSKTLARTPSLHPETRVRDGEQGEMIDALSRALDLALLV